MWVEIDNAYDDGYEERTTLHVEEPAALTEEWWDDEVWPHTGVGRSGDAIYTATVTHADNPALIGETWEWGG